MSMYCDYPVHSQRNANDDIVITRCHIRLWPSETSGRTYANETQPIVERDANGKITSIRCKEHADEHCRETLMKRYLY